MGLAVMIYWWFISCRHCVSLSYVSVWKVAVTGALCQVLIESYSSSGPYSIRTAVKAAFIQLLSVFVERLVDVSSRLVSVVICSVVGLCHSYWCSWNTPVPSLCKTLISLLWQLHNLTDKCQTFNYQLDIVWSGLVSLLCRINFVWCLLIA